MIIINCLKKSTDKIRLLNNQNNRILFEKAFALRQYATNTDVNSKKPKDAPIKFSTSDAKKWDPINTFISEKARKQPISQPFIVVSNNFFLNLFQN